MKLGGLDISSLRIGGQAVTKAYLGDTLVYGGGQPQPSSGIIFSVNGSIATMSIPSYSALSAEAKNAYDNDELYITIEALSHSHRRLMTGNYRDGRCYAKTKWRKCLCVGRRYDQSDGRWKVNSFPFSASVDLSGDMFYVADVWKWHSRDKELHNSDWSYDFSVRAALKHGGMEQGHRRIQSSAVATYRKVGNWM